MTDKKTPQGTVAENDRELIEDFKKLQSKYFNMFDSISELKEEEIKIILGSSYEKLMKTMN